MRNRQLIEVLRLHLRLTGQKKNHDEKARIKMTDEGESSTNSYDEDVDEPTAYCLKERDWLVIEAAKTMLWKMVRSPGVKPRELVGIGKALHVLQRLPQITEDINVNVGVCSPKKWYGDKEIFRYWSVEIADVELSISSGGSHYTQEVGSDSFTSFSWWAAPGSQTRYRDYVPQHWMIPELADFASEISSLDLSNENYEFSVSDENDQFDTDDDDVETC